MTHIHVGHHFFGAGNLGDDLMLAGFLEVIRGRPGDFRLSCCIPWDIVAMRRRFPEIDWLPYEVGHRRDCIATCDAWVGLGDTPFQTSVGDWLLDHLLGEAELCAAAGKRMFYVGVGVNDVAAAVHPKTAALVRKADHIWTRDATSIEALKGSIPDARMSVGSDLAHLFLARHVFSDPTPRQLGIVLNFEDHAQFTVSGLADLVDGLQADFNVRWLAQEVRGLSASEVTLHARLPERVRQMAPLVVPDYAGAPTVTALLGEWGVPEVIVTSRYHASLIAAWMGSRAVAFPRSLKVHSSISELGLVSVVDLSDVGAAREAIERARRTDVLVLDRHRQLAQRACDEALDAIAGGDS